MPDVITSGGASAVPSRVRAWCDAAEAVRFVAMMAWPDNARAQREALATWAGVTIGLLQELRPDDSLLSDARDLEAIARAAGISAEELSALPATPAVREKLLATGQELWIKSRAAAVSDIQQNVLDPAGGLLMLAAARGVRSIAADLAKVAETREGPAGLALAMLVSAAEHHVAELPSVSVNRVLWAMERPGRSLRLLKDAWAGSLAPHLWAALQMEARRDLTAQGDTQPEAWAALLETAEGRARVAAGAEWLAAWGRQFVPAGAQRPVLAGRRLVKTDAPPRKPYIPRLSADALRRMTAYRAPTLLA